MRNSQTTKEGGLQIALANPDVIFHTYFVFQMARCVWETAETKALIDLWGEETVQKELDGAKRTKGIYQTNYVHGRSWL